MRVLFGSLAASVGDQFRGKVNAFGNVLSNLCPDPLKCLRAGADGNRARIVYLQQNLTFLLYYV